MFKQTAIALGLAMASSAVFAAGTGTSSQASAGANKVGVDASANVSTEAMFDQLDTDGNGVLSAAEAKANPMVAKMYDAMDTSASIKSDPKASAKDKASANGVTLDQFNAGMQAAANGSLGPAVSGGETYTVMKNGTKQKIRDGATGAQTYLHGQMQQAGQQASGMRDSTAHHAQAMGAHAGDAINGARQSGSKAAGAAMGTAGATAQQGMHSQTQMRAGGSAAGNNASVGADADMQTHRMSGGDQ